MVSAQTFACEELFMQYASAMARQPAYLHGLCHTAISLQCSKHLAARHWLDSLFCLRLAVVAGLVVFVLVSFNTLAGVQAKVAQLVKDVVGSEYDPLAGPSADGSGPPPPYIPFKGGSHVE